MKKTVKNTFTATMGLALLSLNKVSALDLVGSTGQDARLVGTSNTIDVVLQNWLAYLTGFLYFIAIAMMIWGGFNIITAGGEEEKVKKGKTILMQAAAGLIVVFLANSLISWIIDLLFANA